MDSYFFRLFSASALFLSIFFMPASAFFSCESDAITTCKRLDANGPGIDMKKCIETKKAKCME